MADTSVHYNSPAPAQLGALAYASGSQIHVSPGQEKHLPHEAWHVVQQKQGRVKPTLQAKGLAVNDDDILESEADVMGQRAMQLKTTDDLPSTPLNTSVLQTANVIQRKIGFEFQAYDSIYFTKLPDGKPILLGEGPGFKVTRDSGADKDELEIITDPLNETKEDFDKLGRIMDGIVLFLAEIENGIALTDIKPPIVNWGSSGAIKDSKFSIPKGVKHFHPQTTVGIKFEKIAELIDYLTQAPFKQWYTPGAEIKRAEPGGPATIAEVKSDGIAPSPPKTITEEIIRDPEKTALAGRFGWSGKADQQPFKRAWATGLQQARKLLGRENQMVQGFAAIMYGFRNYMESGDKPEDDSAVKYYMPLLFRSGLVPFYDAMTPDEKRTIDGYFSEDDTIILPSPKQGMFLRVGNVPAISEIVGFLKRETGNRELINELSPGHGQIKEETIKNWGMETVSDIGSSDKEETRRGAVIELRKLGNNVPPENLKGYAEAVFTLIRLINDPGDPRPMPARSAPTGAPTGPTAFRPAPNELTPDSRRLLVEAARRQNEAAEAKRQATLALTHISISS